MEPIAILIYRIIDIYFYIVIANVIISWLVAFKIINTYNQFVAMILYATRRLTDPLLNPIRRFLPNLGGVDISPIVLILLLLYVQDSLRVYFFNF
ncbi:MAG: YggT family protein [Pelagibacterales bacterium]|nr:YggT family protein [Pelagibacterales bacterium]